MDEYHAWVAMFHRCYYPSQRGYAACGGLGITVCPEWTVFATFLRDVGPRPSDEHRLMRIDEKRPFAPGNVRWQSRADRQPGCRPKITAEELRQLVNYDPEMGVFTWKVDRRMGRTGKGKLIAPAGREIGDRTATHWYPQVNIRKNVYLLHRLAFLYMTGEWPNGEVDHIDGNRGNNSWKNLRDVPRRVNSQNIRRPKSHNKLGVLGVYEARSGQFVARVKDGGSVYTSRHESADQAHQAYLQTKRQVHEGCTI